MSCIIKHELRRFSRFVLCLIIGLLWFISCRNVSADPRPDLLSSLTQAPGAQQVSTSELLDGMYVFSPQITENSWMTSSGNWDQAYLSRLRDVRPDLLKSWWPLCDVNCFSNCASKIVNPSDKGNIWVEYHNVGSYLDHEISMRITFLDWEYDSELPADDYAFIAVTVGEKQSSYPATPNVEIRCLKWVETKYEFFDEEGRQLELSGHMTLTDLDYSQGFQVLSPYDGMYFTASSAARNKYEPGTGCVWNVSNDATLPSNNNGWITYVFSGHEIVLRFYDKNTYNPSYSTYGRRYPDWMEMYQKQQEMELDSNRGTPYAHEIWFWRGISQTGFVYRKDGYLYADPIEGSSKILNLHGWGPSEYGFSSSVPFAGYSKKGNVVLTKTDSMTGQKIHGAAFTCYEWNGTDYSELADLIYDEQYDAYYLENLAATDQNQGCFKIVETRVPEGYQDAWSQEFQITQSGLTTFTFEAENMPVTGSLRIRKSDKESGQALSGAVFGLWAKTELKSPSGLVLYPAGTNMGQFPATDASGEACLNGLLPGTYELEELEAPSGYIRDTARYPIELKLDEETDDSLTEQSQEIDEAEGPWAEIQLQNTKNHLILCKTGFVPETQESIPLSDIQFLIWHKDQSEAEGIQLTTDTKGRAEITGLASGVWMIREIKTRSGYALDSQIYQVTVDESGQINQQDEIELNLVNHAITLEILKEDAVSGRLVSGAEFQLYDAQNSLVRTFTTNNQPVLLSGLEPGTYRLEETIAPPGYLPHDSITVAVSDTADRQPVHIPETPLVSLRLRKKISAEEIHWEHGEPTFFLNVSGEDLNGISHTWHLVFPFTREYVQEHTESDGTVVMEQVLSEIPAGNSYEITETDTLRYGLWMVTGSSNAAITMLTPPAAGKKNKELFSVIIDLTKNGQDSYVCFWNRKYRWDDYSHTALKVNRFPIGLGDGDNSEK